MWSKQQKLAIFSQALYLANLLVLPLLALLPLTFLYLKTPRGAGNELAAHHITVALLFSLLALIVISTGVVVFVCVGDYGAPAWTALILYLIVMHTSFVFFGIIALARAMSGRQVFTSGHIRNY